MADKLSKRIRGKLRNYSFIDYVLSCVERYSDIEFRDYCRHRSFSTISFYNILSRNSDEKYYYIKSGNAFSGFGAEFRRTIDALYFADYYGLVPYVEYTDKYIYYEPDGVNGISNPFEYYFEQPSQISKKVLEQNPYILFTEEHRRLIQNTVVFTNSYELSDEYLELAGAIVKKYIKINESTKSYIERSIQGVVGEDTIGVHYRGTDFNVGYKRHPNVVTIEDYFEAIDKMLEKNRNASIFVASDEQSAIDKFRARYEKRITCFDDVFRSKDGKPVHFSDDLRAQHHYRLGLEILRDIMALSKCNSLIAGLSQVNYCAQIFKKSTNIEYKNLSIISKGIK